MKNIKKKLKSNKKEEEKKDTKEKYTLWIKPQLKRNHYVKKP